MTTSREKVLELVASGKISAAEGDELLAALETSRRNIFSNPFEALTLAQTLLIGALGCLAGLALSRLNIRFDGAIDVHTTSKAVPFTVALLDQLVAWPLTAFVFWLGALIPARRSRLIDFIGVVGLARLPLILTGLAGAFFGPRLPKPSEGVEGLLSSVFLVVFIVLVIPLVGVSLAILWRGFRHVTGLAGAKAVVVFGLSLVAAEILAGSALKFLVS